MFPNFKWLTWVGSISLALQLTAELVKVKWQRKHIDDTLGLRFKAYDEKFEIVVVSGFPEAATYDFSA